MKLSNGWGLPYLLKMDVEIIDFGFPQNSEIDTLKMYITTESIKSEMAVVCPFLTLLPLIPWQTLSFCSAKTRQRSPFRQQEQHLGDARMSSIGRTRLLSTLLRLSIC